MSDQQGTTEGAGQTKASSVSLLDRWNASVRLVESSPLEAIPSLENLQTDISTVGLFSSNETIEDVGSKSIPLLGLDYYLGMAHLNVPCTGKERMLHLEHGMHFLTNFLQRLEQYELLSSDQTKEYQEILELIDIEEEEGGEAFFGGPRNSNVTREQKIARYRAKQEIQEKIQKLQALQQRRERLDIADTEELDGHDEESLERKLALSLIQIHTITAMEEWHQAQREVPMVKMMIQAQERNGGTAPERPPPSTGKPLQLTHITKDIGTGQLNIQREEIGSKVFRPSWNQPTMTLQELGDIEVAQAREREAKQAQAESEKMNKPRRYQQLVVDGQEDNTDLVDASAKLDREWDEFRDANPRGSGNKMGDRGNRNF